MSQAVQSRFYFHFWLSPKQEAPEAMVVLEVTKHRLGFAAPSLSQGYALLTAEPSGGSLL
jgi:hypothetical protein